MRIAYPLYLDVPMLTSVLAALDDGLPDGGPLRALGIDLEGRVGAGLAATAENAIAQRHTVASLFNAARVRLADLVKPIHAPADLAGIEDGDFVALSGSLVRNPVYEFITVMERLFALSAEGGEAATTALGAPVPTETRQMFSALRSELDGSPTTAATLRGDSVTAVVNLQRGFLRDLSLDDLRFGRVRVLGKAVGTIPAGQSWQALSSSLVGHMVSGAFRDAVLGLRAVNPESDFPLTLAVEGPALFVVPLAVYV